MKVFVAGTDTDVGKTIVSAWLCLHLGYDYFKPIQTGSRTSNDSRTVASLSKRNVHRESYVFSEPWSPHLAAKYENDHIELDKINVPKSENVIVEGAGGLLVPLNNCYFIIDLIKYLSIPVILTCRSRLGTINHTLLSLQALCQAGIPVLGVVMVGNENPEVKSSIEFYGRTSVLMEMPFLNEITTESLETIPLSDKIIRVFKGSSE